MYFWQLFLGRSYRPRHAGLPALVKSQPLWYDGPTEVLSQVSTTVTLSRRTLGQEFGYDARRAFASLSAGASR